LSLQEFIKRYKSPLEETVDAEMRKIIQKYGVNYKRDLGFMEFPRPGVSRSKFQAIVTEAEQKLKELGYDWYDVFETTIVIDFPGEKKAYEEWERAGRPHSSSHTLFTGTSNVSGFSSILNKGPVRRWLSERKPFLFSQAAVYPPVDRELEAKRETKRREWKARGYPDALIERALLLADGWISSLADTFGGGDPKVREAIIRSSYDKALSVGENWIVAMLK